MSLSLSTARYPMRVVLRRTGLTPDLLRAWERRYGAVAPSRSPGGQRLHSEADVEQLTLLHRATLNGHAVSRIADLSPRQLRVLLGDNPGSRPAVRTPGDASALVLRHCMEAVHWLDCGALDSLLRRAAINLGPLRFADDIVRPLVRRLAEPAGEGLLRGAHEDASFNVIREVISSLLMFAPIGTAAPILVTVSTDGRPEEISARLAGIVAASEGWRPLHLGEGLAGDEVGLAARRARARAVVACSGEVRADAALAREFEKLVTAVAGEMPVFVVGLVPDLGLRRLDRIDLTTLESLAELQDHLRLPAPVRSRRAPNESAHSPASRSIGAARSRARAPPS